MATIAKNTVFTNVGETSDGGVWWEGLAPPAAGVTLTDWHGKAWKPGKVCRKCVAGVGLGILCFTSHSVPVCFSALMIMHGVALWQVIVR